VLRWCGQCGMWLLQGQYLRIIGGLPVAGGYVGLVLLVQVIFLVRCFPRRHNGALVVFNVHNE
jgi:hypothetical protein